MKRWFSLVVVVWLFGGGLTGSAKPRWEERKEWGKPFLQADVKGCFLLYDLRRDRYFAFDKKRATTGYIPASTFKIFNSLVALETGVLSGIDEALKWDGVDRGSDGWNQDQNMRQAFSRSTVWFYQEVARRVGQPRMQGYLNRVGYGNRNLSGGIDRFWLDGKLRISPLEQLRFLVRLYRNELPFAQPNLDLVKEIFINEKTDAYVLRAKTGWGRQLTPEMRERKGAEIGWWVGYVERADNVYFFALNLDIRKPADADQRKPIAREILRAMKIIE